MKEAIAFSNWNSMSKAAKATALYGVRKAWKFKNDRANITTAYLFNVQEDPIPSDS